MDRQHVRLEFTINSFTNMLYITMTAGGHVLQAFIINGLL